MASTFVYCNVCGARFETEFKLWDGRYCSTKCYRDMQLVQASVVICPPRDSSKKKCP